MMKSTTFVILIVISTVALTAGCLSQIDSRGLLPTSGGSLSAPSAPSLSVTSFYSITPEIYEGSSAQLYFAVQNNGYFDAKNVNGTMYNCGSMGTGKIEGTSDPYYCNTEFVIKDELKKPDRELGIAGELTEKQISLDSTGNFPKGRSTHLFSIRVIYDYQSAATRDVVLTSFENWKQKSGTLEVGTLNFNSVSAPISLSLIGPSGPIVVNEGKANPFTFAVNVNNVGKGSLVGKKLNYLELCFDNSTVNVSELGDFDGRNVPNGDCVYIDDSDKLKLLGVEKQWINYDVKFSILPRGVNNPLIQEITTFSASANYTYAVDASTQVVVVGSGG